MTALGANAAVAVPKRHSIFRFEIPQPRTGIDRADKDELGAADSEANVSAKSNAEAQLQANVPAVKPFTFELHGSQFESRATDRATKKFKQRRMDDL